MNITIDYCFRYLSIYLGFRSRFNSDYSLKQPINSTKKGFEIRNSNISHPFFIIIEFMCEIFAFISEMFGIKTKFTNYLYTCLER